MDKKAVITGSSGLIGRVLVRAFLANDYGVYGLDLKRDKTLSPMAHFEFIKTDLKREEQIRSAFGKIKTLNVVINNAAQTQMARKPLEQISLKEWNAGLAANLTSCFLLARFAAPLLRKTGGAIINIASTRHLMSEPHTEIYSASKGGLLSLTHALAMSLAPHVRVNAISPGWIAAPEDKLSVADHQQHPVGRVGRPEDVAQLALYLADAGFVTGQDFVIDGGMTKKMIYV